MNDLLHSPKAKVGAASPAACSSSSRRWFLFVSPQRAKATDLNAQVASARSELAAKKLALANPSATVTVKPSDLYRLTKALPDETDMSGILLDVNRLAARNKLVFQSITPSPSVLGTGYLAQPLAVVVQGRFGNISRFLGDVRTLVAVRGKAPRRPRPPLLGVGGQHHGPRQPENVPDRQGVRDAERVLVHARRTGDHPDPSTTTDSSSSGTVAAGANP